MDLIFLKPVFKEMIWGGNKLRSFGYEIPGDDTGECWAISAHPNGDCVVANGEFAGKTLSELWNEHRELFGNVSGDRFPLLIKIIDAKDDLSIQVHPDDAYAKANENGSLGKMECWYILDCEENTSIVIGHNAKDSAEVADMINNKRWGEFIREIPVHKGDFFQINPGCLHAIKGGTVILETQQNSDITYRVYDYDRLQNGKPRQLHVQQSIDVIKAPFVPADASDAVVSDLGDCIITHFITCQYYSVEKLEVKGSITFDMEDPFMNVSVCEGEGMINGVPIKKGDHFIIPADFGEYTLEGNMMLIRSYTDFN
jgi:mannose-6-phosphate isomerase class I